MKLVLFTTIYASILLTRFAVLEASKTEISKDHHYPNLRSFSRSRGLLSRGDLAYLAKANDEIQLQPGDQPCPNVDCIPPCIDPATNEPMCDKGSECIQRDPSVFAANYGGGCPDESSTCPVFVECRNCPELDCVDPCLDNECGEGEVCITSDSIPILTALTDTKNDGSNGCPVCPVFVSCTPVCHLPPDPGICAAYFVNWYYNGDTGVCDTFVYGGCGGKYNTSY